MRRRMLAATMAAAVVAGLVMVSRAPAAPANLTKQSDGWVYFNRPGSDMAATEAQMAACTVAIDGWRPGYVASQGLLINWIGGSMWNASLAVAFENCMVLRGWRVVRVPDAEGPALMAMKPEALAATLKDWVGATEPHGTVVRTWGNDAAKADTVVHVFVPGVGYRDPLNVRALKPATRSESKDAVEYPSPFNQPRYSRTMPVTPAQLAAAPADSAAVVFTLRNSAPTDWTRIVLIRMGPAPQTPAYSDGRPDRIFVFVTDKPKGGAKGSPVSQTWGFVVPPGRWALANISDMVSLCLGAPFVDVKAGEVVNLGALDFGRDGRPIDLDPAPAKAFLESQPALAARVRPAAWINGATFSCLGAPYALEYPDLPYAPGYLRGGTPSPAK